MLETLHSFYTEQKISATSFMGKEFLCKYFKDQCGAGKKYFVPAKEAFIGTRYEKHDIPRLLVVSLDPKPTEHYHDRNHRTVYAVREHEELSPTENYYDLDEKSHWRKTFDMVFELLRDFINSRDRDKVRPFFAHTNSSKCHDKVGSDESSSELFDNCQEYLYAEIPLLAPDVVVTQGALWHFRFMNEFVNLEEDWALLANYKELPKIHPIQINNQKALWIETNHPCRRDNSYKVEDQANFSRYRQLIMDFWKQNKR